MSHSYCMHKVPIFKNLSLIEMDELTPLLIHLEFNKGEELFHPGEKSDQLYIINEGKVKISRISPEGKEQVISVLEVGDFIGEKAIFNDEETTDHATALEYSKICIIKRDDLLSHMEKNPKTSIKIVQALSQKLNDAEQLVEWVSIRSAEWRLAKTLLDYMDKNNIFTFTTTKALFASQLGMTQETLSRKLSDFKASNYIEILSSKQIKILNIDELEIIVNE